MLIANSRINDIFLNFFINDVFWIFNKIFRSKKKIQQKMAQDEDDWAKGDLNEDEMLPAN